MYVAQTRPWEIVESSEVRDKLRDTGLLVYQGTKLENLSGEREGREKGFVSFEKAKGQ